MADDNEHALRSAVEAFNDRDRREDYLRLYAEEVVLHGYPRGLEGLEGAGRFYRELWRAFPDARLELEDVIGSGDTLAARYTLTGLQRTDFYGTPVTGERATLEGIAWLRFEDGRAVEVWQTSATLDTLTRLTARAAEARMRHSASADAAALRWEERQADEADG